MINAYVCLWKSNEDHKYATYVNHDIDMMPFGSFLGTEITVRI